MGNNSATITKPSPYFGPLDKFTTTIENGYDNDPTICKDCKKIIQKMRYIKPITYESDVPGGNMIIVDGDVITFNTPLPVECSKCKFSINFELVHDRGFMFVGPPNSKIEAIYGKCAITDELVRQNFNISVVPNFGVIIQLTYHKFPNLIWLEDRSATCSETGLVECTEINGLMTGCFISGDTIHIINSSGEILPYTMLKRKKYEIINRNIVQTIKVDEGAELVTSHDLKTVTYISTKKAPTRTKAAIH